MNEIYIKSVDIIKNKIFYNYDIKGDWKKFFDEDEKMYVEYDENVESIPYSIAIIPFLCNILPILWISDAKITLEEIDEDFYRSIPKFKEGYINMYPNVDFKGTINVSRIIDNKKEEFFGELCLFSGGVDAFYTLLSNIDKTPDILTVWGSDIKLDDKKGWDKVLSHTINTAKAYNINAKWIKSNFRNFIKEGELTSEVIKKANDGWWHGFQHGVGLIGLNAPIAYKNKIKTIYIASSFTIEEKGKVTCASDPTIDNYVRFCGSRVNHYGYDFNRQDKINFICNYSNTHNKKIPLRVCWESKGGSNCCRCEKCYRTIFGILSEKNDPRNFGFNYTDEEFDIIIKDFKYRVFPNISRIIYPQWKNIQDAIRKNYSIDDLDQRLIWFYKKDIYEEKITLNKIVFKVYAKIKRKLLRLK